MADEWQLIFDAIEWPILVLDLEGKLHGANRAACEALGWRRTDVLGRSLAAFGRLQPWRQVGELVPLLRDTGYATSCRVRDGTSGAAWEIGARRYVEPRSAGTRIVAAIHRLEAGTYPGTRPADRMAALGALVAGVAHEVRNPLFGMLATLDAFEARFGQQGGHEAYLTALRGELDRLKTLMQGLLDYGGPSACTRAPGSVQDVLVEAVRQCAALAGQARVTVRCRVARPLAPVTMNRARLVQAFENLLRNAIQHSPAEGTVTVAARPCTLEDAQMTPDSPMFWRVALEADEPPRGDAAWTECTVADSGPGFRPEDLPRVFAPFFTRRPGGTGLGLSIVERIVEEHGGHVFAANRPEGGALMTVRLPCAAEAPAAPASRERGP